MNNTPIEDYLPHRAWAEISLNRLVHNFAQVQGLVGECVVACVVKGNSYGHGAVQCARALAANGATFFITSTGEEALQLRRHGLNLPILTLSMPTPALIPTLAEQDIAVTIGNKDMACLYASVLGTKPLKIHVKVETGLNRTGFALQNAVADIVDLAKRPCFTLEGVYSHFAVAEDEAQLDFTKHQLEDFVQVLEGVLAQNIDIPYRHIANSASIMAYRTSYDHPLLNMVRPGMLLLGVNPSARMPIDLLPILSLHSQITQIKTVLPGETISYGRTYSPSKPAQIATISIGYADGLRRDLTQKITVLLHGKHVLQVGRIAMDACMIDVTDIPMAAVGDKVTVLGQNGSEEIHIDQLSAKAGTIPNEFLSGINMRVPRVFVHDGVIKETVSYLP